jgi:hypothetical protein
VHSLVIIILDIVFVKNIKKLTFLPFKS